MPDVDRASVDRLRERVCRVLDDIALFRWRIAGVVAVIGVGVFVYLFGQSGSYVPSPDDVAAVSATTAPQPPMTAPAELVVSAAGAVNRPGLYTLAMNARVADVLSAAGGVTAEADLDRINLAAKVADGERVYVLRRGQTPPDIAGGEAGAGGSGRGPTIVDLNTASLEQLDSLPGIGPTTAQAIVQYRQQHGPFRSVQELTKVKGIGPSKLAQLEELVRIQ